jgi:predicted dehydrogenase
VLFDLGVHHFDLWRFLVQSEVAEVFAQTRADDHASECATVSARMGNGVLVTAAFSHGLSDTNEIEICGQTGRLELSCYHSHSFRVCEPSASQGAIREWLDGTVRAARNLPRAVMGLRHGGDVLASYRTQWQHFLTAIGNDTSVECSVAEGRSALQVTLAAIESASSGQPVNVAGARPITPIGSAARANRTAG